MDIANNIERIRQQIDKLIVQYLRKNSTVQLVAVSKGQSTAQIRAVFAAGQRCFGENYLQEALPKIIELRSLPIEWHFIGKIQRNKTSQIARYFDWVETIDRWEVAQRLDQQRPPDLGTLNCCIEVNISGEISKNGVAVDDVLPLTQRIQSLKRLQLRGLMVIPRATDNFQEQLQIYQQVQKLQHSLQQQGIELDTLSMGMSNDFAAAIAAGSTSVRIGTAIFGVRL